MAVIQSDGQIASVDRAWAPLNPGGGIRLYGEHFADYAALFRTQPAVRRVVGFLARNVAQLGLPVFRRVSDTDRERLSDHPLARTINRPNPWTTRYRLIESLMYDKGIYDDAFWMKFHANDGSGDVALVRLPPAKVTPVGDNWLYPDAWKVTGSRGSVNIPAAGVVHFHGYNPTDSRMGLSPLETLRGVLAEEHAMAEYRENLWRRGARFEGVLTRPADAPVLSPAAKDRFWLRWNASYTGEQAAMTALLEEGMDYKQVSFSARDAQYLETRKLNIEEVAGAYFVAPVMVGILDNANYSNVEAYHKSLYQDTLGPSLTEIEEEIDLQLLPEYLDQDRVYVEFNLAEKLKGSFEEQAASLSTLVGRPVMTADEGRARLNLPSLGGDAAGLVTPLNVLIGGQASPTDTAPPPKARGMKALPAALAPLSGWVAKHDEVLKAYFAQQKAAAEDGDDLDPDSWDAVLHPQLHGLAREVADEAGKARAEQLGGDWDLDLAAGWLLANALAASTNINTTTAEQYAAAAAADEPAKIQDFWAVTEDSRAGELATARVSTVGNFADHEGAAQSGATTKTWVVNSSKPRASHAQMSGETVGIDEPFSNGGHWPHDSRIGDVDEIAGCTCTLSYGTEAG